MTDRAPTFTTMSFRALVEAADPDFYKEGTQPVVYKWPRGAERRDAKPLYNFPNDTYLVTDDGLFRTTEDGALRITE